LGEQVLCKHQVAGSKPVISTIFITNEDIMIEPLGKRVYIAEIKAERKTASGIILDGATSVKETKFAEVLEIGYDVKKVRKGDKVVIDWGKCIPVKINDTERALIDEDHILAIYRGE
jgi:co-chaperonin GroES (HSP10)